jgi:hypothetical protein
MAKGAADRLVGADRHGEREILRPIDLNTMLAIERRTVER